MTAMEQGGADRGAGEHRRGRRGAKLARIEDVARHSGFSPMTVSRVINGYAGVRPATIAAVRRSIEALDFAPSEAAQRLAGAREDRIALIYSGPSQIYLSELLVGALHQCRRAQVQFVIEQYDRGPSGQDPAGQDLAAKELVAKLVKGRVEGVILTAALADAGALIERLAATGIAVVAITNGGHGRPFASVGIDDRRAAFEMTRHLVDLGHRRIGFIRGDPDHSASDRRFEGYAEALAQAGFAVDPALVTQGRFTYRSGLEAAQRLIDLPHPPSAIFASNDDMAAAAIAFAHQRGLRVPDDISICGFDDTPIATTIWPELTTIHQPLDAMAEAAIDMLADLLRAGSEARGVPEERLLDYRLVLRQSTAAPGDRRGQGAEFGARPSPGGA
jgi:LacI family transcriptional regulator